MRFIKLTLSYDGTDFAGWQVQPHKRTVQDTFQQAIHKLTGQATSVVASGRTDAGVHALGQVVSFSTQSLHPLEVLLKALNAHLPHDVSVVDVREEQAVFNAIRDARRKTYRYVIQDGPRTDIFLRRYSWRITDRLDERAMHLAAQLLVGTHDFSSFESSGSKRASPVRTIYRMIVERRAGGIGNHVVMEVTADGFLYNMVRSIVGTLVDIGRGTSDQSSLRQILEARNRQQAGRTAPPQGLFLVNVEYDC